MAAWLLALLVAIWLCLQTPTVSYAPIGSAADAPAWTGEIVTEQETPPAAPLVISRPTTSFADAWGLWGAHAPDVVWDADHQTAPIPMTAQGLAYLKAIGKWPVQPKEWQ